MKLKFNGISSKRTYLFATSHFLHLPLQLTIHKNFITITRQAMYKRINVTLRRVRTNVVAVENEKYFIF